MTSKTLRNVKNCFKYCIVACKGQHLRGYVRLSLYFNKNKIKMSNLLSLTIFKDSLSVSRQAVSQLMLLGKRGKLP